MVETKIKALGELTSNTKNRDTVINAGGVAPVVKAMRLYISRPAAAHCCTVLGNIAFKSAKNKAEIKKEGGVMAVVDVLTRQVRVCRCTRCTLCS